MAMLSSEHGTYKTVKAIFWPWLSGKRIFLTFEVVSSLLGSGLTISSSVPCVIFPVSLSLETKWLPKWLGYEPRLIVMSLDS